MMDQKFDAELNALQKMVDARKEALDIEKDIYDYHNQIAEKTKSITNLQKQLAAYSGDSSQEGQSKLQKIQYELSEAQKDLEDTEYERYISDQKDMLDKLLKEFEEGIEKQLKDFNDTVNKGLNIANENSSNILETLKNFANNYDYAQQYQGVQNTSLQGYVDQILSAIKAVNGTESAPTTPAPVGTNSTTSNNSNNSNGNQIEEKLSKLNQEKHRLMTQRDSEVNQLQVEMEKSLLKKKNDKVNDINNKIQQVIQKYEQEITNIDREMNSITMQGFSKGGVISVRNLEEQVKANGDSVLVSANPGEGFLTAKQTDLIQKFGENLESFDFSKNIQDLVKMDIPIIPDFSSDKFNRSGNNVVNIDTLELPNVTNYEEFRTAMFNEMKTNKQFEGMVQDMSIKRINGGSSLAKNRYKF